MAASSSLRDRRRRQTQQDIQRAALTLALEHGLDSVTTEMIATQAGISLRTFFNYYPNKDAAIVGMPPDITLLDVNRFRASNGALIDDLFDLLAPLLAQSDLDRESSRMIGVLLDRWPQMLPIFHASLARLHDKLAELTHERLGADRGADAELVADVISHAISHGFRIWATDASVPNDKIVALARDQVRRLALILND